MQTQAWRNAGVEWRRPDLADGTLAAIAWYLLHTTPQVPEVIPVAVAFILLRCVRVHRPAETRR
ncbi:hypothetical protein [Streptomyces sp. NBRC 110028]|uniref:hypothetical protein n=1 Tax=Streptomyces sp. NBRC 110028 TaxID=1621260 RepID=UPI0006E3F165|nr:hypothetical protein [Streptomyces sp. NBRC 110028]